MPKRYRKLFIDEYSRQEIELKQDKTIMPFYNGRVEYIEYDDLLPIPYNPLEID